MRELYGNQKEQVHTKRSYISGKTKLTVINPVDAGSGHLRPWGSIEATDRRNSWDEWIRFSRVVRSCAENVENHPDRFNIDMRPARLLVLVPPPKRVPAAGSSIPCGAGN